MNEHNNNDGQMEETMTDAKNPWNADLNDPYLGIEARIRTIKHRAIRVSRADRDGIASAAQRASLEYADAVLIGWPEVDAEDVVELDEEKLKSVDEPRCGSWNSTSPNSAPWSANRILTA